MQKHVTDQTPATPEQLAILAGEVYLAITRAKPTFCLVQKLLESKRETRKFVADEVLKALRIIPEPRLPWQVRLFGDGGGMP